MADQTVHAEALIQTAARAFYDDDVVCLIDVLIRDKYLRDDDMGQRLSLPARKLRVTMQFLQEEFLVKYEHVNDLSSGGSQTTKYWYIDFNHAVNVIRYRIYLLKKKLDEDELRARSNSMYLCPGYRDKVCNGRYTETQAQQIVDPNTGHFFCQECFFGHKNNPEPPPPQTYTLQLQDNAKDLRQAQENIRRIRVQLQAKMIGNTILRPGIYDLLQKVRHTHININHTGLSNMSSHTKYRPLSNNLPSENIEKNIGTKRIEGTGRTAGIKKKRDKLLEGARRTEEGTDLNFLKNQKGEEISFEVEKGGGARANLLATQTTKRTKLMDAAASRVGAGTPPPTNQQDNDAGANNAKKGGNEKKNKTTKMRVLPGLPFFLRENVSDQMMNEDMRVDESNNNNNTNNNDNDQLRHPSVDLPEDYENLQDGQKITMSDEQRRATFQALYKLELARQKSIFLSQYDSANNNNHKNGNSGGLENDDADYDNILWVDG